MLNQVIQQIKINFLIENYIKNNRNLRTIGLVSSIILVFISILSIYPISNNNNDAEALNGVTSTTSLDMTLDHTAANLDLVVGSSSGTFAMSDSDSLASFTVATNNYTGYTLSIVGSDDTGLLTNTDSTITTNNTLSSITSAIDAGVFGGDTATSLNGKWGYQPSKYYDLASNAAVDNTDFLPSPTTSASTLNITACANGTPTTTCPNNQAVDEYTIAIGARADYTTPAGTYTNTFILSVVTNDVPFTITFNDNTNDSTVSSLPSTVSSVTADTDVALPTTIPTRTGYTFTGWCDTVTTVNANGSTTCTNPTTGASGTVYPASTASTTSYLDFIDQTASSNIASLYAMWTAKTYTISITNSNTSTNGITSLTISYKGQSTINVTPSSGYYLSNVSCPTGYTCSGYNTGSSYTGQQTVTITNNGTDGGGTLAFTSTTSAYCTASDSNCMQYSDTYKSCGNTLMDARDGKTYTTAAIGDLCYMTKNLDLAGGTTLTSALSNVTSDYTLPASSTSGFSDSSTAYVYNSNSTTCGSNSPCYSYYSYAAAAAGANPSSGDASSDICPKGWRLPTQADLNTLYNSYNTGAKLTKSPFLGVYAGYYFGSSFNYGGDYGYYWSSTTDSSTSAYSLYFSSNDADVLNRNSRFGLSARCVRQTAPTNAEILRSATMQSFTKSQCEKYASSSAVSIKDARDGNTYTVRYIGSLCWMTQNLRFKGTSISAADTNINTTKTISYGDLTSGNSYDAARIHDSGNTTNGVWYNYAAASAMTITGSSNSTEASYSVCPAGWRLPTNSEQSGITSSASAFSPVTGGYYGNGSLYASGYGFWWSSTAYDTTTRYRLGWDGSSLDTDYGNRDGGRYIRCVHP